MERAVIVAALMCGFAGHARADDASGDPSLSERATGAVTSAAEGAREGADRVTKAAGEKASEVADHATDAAKKATDAAEAHMRDAAKYGKNLAGQMADGAKEKADALGRRFGSTVDAGKGWFAAAWAGMREATRTMLLSAANALDASNAKERNDARLSRWDDVRSRFGFESERPSPTLSDELREHEFRVARLMRAREVADAADDQRAVKRSDRLLETEYARHHDRLEALREEERSMQQAEAEP